jgi:mRNA-degrading endonuclease RelE of RelBE toxin-antitoxin system
MALMQVDYGEGFKRQVKRLSKRYRSIKSDIKPIIDSLLAGEIIGDQLSGYEHSLYKVRVKNSDNLKGKSGGYRCIYYLKTETHCTLVTIYSKSDQGDIEADELNKLLREITEKA